MPSTEVTLVTPAGSVWANAAAAARSARVTDLKARMSSFLKRCGDCNLIVWTGGRGQGEEGSQRLRLRGPVKRMDLHRTAATAGNCREHGDRAQRQPDGGRFRR